MNRGEEERQSAGEDCGWQLRDASVERGGEVAGLAGCERASGCDGDGAAEEQDDALGQRHKTENAPPSRSGVGAGAQ